MKPDSKTFRHNRSCAICWSILFLLLSILCAAPSLLAGISEHSSQHPRIATAYFAIADFDGDQRPDLATVRAERRLHEARLSRLRPRPRPVPARLALCADEGLHPVAARRRLIWP